MGAIAQNNPKEPAPAPAASSSSACPSASATSPQHLYGLWQVQWGDGTAPAELQLGRHPEFAESVRGSLRRAGQLAQVVGDLEDGDFTLEESENGRNIAATWIGRIVDPSCGKEIRGTWTYANPPRSTSFTLRKLPGWR